MARFGLETSKKRLSECCCAAAPILNWVTKSAESELTQVRLAQIQITRFNGSICDRVWVGWIEMNLTRLPVGFNLNPLYNSGLRLIGTHNPIIVFPFSDR